ncbi:MAG: cytochrome c [Hyphomonadaceae bacterium]|nr:cytochrome c [Hyphomonadaceae bacterium]
MRHAIRAASLGAAIALSAIAGFAVAQTSTASVIETRESQFRRLGAAFKGMNEAVRAREPNMASIRANAVTIEELAQQLPTWFPAGSGPGAGAPTAAKTEIWSDAAGFADQAHLFQTAAADLSAAARRGEMSAIRTEVRTLGQRCASCHTEFRERDN